MVPSTNTILENKVFKKGNFLLDERRIQPHISFYSFPVSSSISFIDFIVLANSAQPNYDCFITPYRTNNLYAEIQQKIKEQEELQLEQQHSKGKA